MPRATGYERLDHRPCGGILEERDTVHCAHCQGLIYRARRGAGYVYFTLAERAEVRGGRFVVERREVDAAWCSDCGAQVCDTEACATVCVPFTRRVNQVLARRAFWRAVGLE